MTQGKFAIVDDEDYEWLSQWKWCISGTGYALRRGGQYDGERRRKAIFLHGEVNKTPKHLLTDHINGDRLDNRRSNLRSCTHGDNHHNTKTYATNKSGYKGVSKSSKEGVWRARINLNDKEIHLGTYAVKEHAALAYNKAATQYFGEFARLNVVQ